MLTASVIPDPGRLFQLKSLNLFGKPTEEHFDTAVELVATALRVRSAFINFVDETHTRCKAVWGALREHRLNEECLCPAAIENGDTLVIPDTTADPHYASHPIATDERQVRFYAGVVLRLPGGMPLGTLCVMDQEGRQVDERDIAVLRKFAQQIIKHLEGIQAQHEIRSLQDRLDHAQRNRDQFLAMLAHELRAPLAPILTAVQLLERSSITSEQRAWSKAVLDRHVKFLSDIVDHMLSASLVSFGKVELVLEPISVRALVDQAVEMSQGHIMDGAHSFTCSIVDEPFVLADRTQCALLISNLLSNAAKYTPRGGTIDLAAEPHDGQVEVRVRDSGVGIAIEDIDEIFEIFGQSKQPLDRAMGGMGLGLALSRRLAEWHGGSLKARSAGRGHGSEFILTLRPADRPAAVDADDQAESVLGLESPLDIIIVEDNVDTADALGLFYRVSGHTVRVAYRAQDAMSMMMARQPDVVISDIGLPDTNGYELVRRLTQINALSRTVFIAVSGYASEMDREKAFKAGFDEHFAKPVDLTALNTLLARMTRDRQPRSGDDGQD